MLVAKTISNKKYLKYLIYHCWTVFTDWYVAIHDEDQKITQKSYHEKLLTTRTCMW